MSCLPSFKQAFSLPMPFFPQIFYGLDFCRTTCCSEPCDSDLRVLIVSVHLCTTHKQGIYIGKEYGRLEVSDMGYHEHSPHTKK